MGGHIKMAKDKKSKAEASEMVMVTNGQARHVYFRGHKLIPGVNRVPRDVAEAIKAHPTIKQLVSVGKMDVADDDVATKELAPEKAKAIVSNTNDKKVLAKIESEDRRPEVAEAIREKREELKPKSEKKD